MFHLCCYCDDLAKFPISVIPRLDRGIQELSRYAVSDYYLNFYFKFIKPIKADIQQGDYNQQPTQALDMASYQKWLGYAFERFCRRQQRLIAQLLGFSAVKYRHGVYFNRNTEKSSPGYQFDLIFDRADNVMTLCEIKYYQAKVGTDIIQAFENKLALLNVPSSKSIHKVLITTEGASDSLIARAYFDRIIVLSELFVGRGIR